MAKRIYLVTGSRTWGHYSKTHGDPEVQLERKRMCAVFKRLVPGSIVLHGLANGADKWAEEESSNHGLFSMGMPYAGWLGRGGGPARNRKMQTVMVGLREAGWATRVLSFHQDLARSKGTLDMVSIALDERFPVTHISVVSAQTLRSSNDLRKYLKG